MEVDTVKVNNLVGCFKEQADEPSLSLEGSDAYNVFGDPDIFPCVGQQYQVEIPPLISESDYLFQKKPCDPESIASNTHESVAGLPIPVVWIQGEVQKEDAFKLIGVIHNIDYSKLGCIKETQNSLDSSELPTPEAIDSTSIKTEKMGEYGDSYVQQATKVEVHEKHKFKGISLVPDSSSGTWNEIEEASFILGLYIFGKNLVQVKRFVGNKNMGDILSFYYGKFYRTDGYQRWSECRKMRSRKCIYGQKIFRGSRQQELLSRLLPNLSEDCCDNLRKVSKAFAEGKMLLEDYVLSLKASVGLSAFIEAVGVGKGNDLTGINAESLKPTQILPVRPEIPVGKACSMLTLEEIITFLTGNFRRSKARSSDLFWEAVWPRLLARGWHSEQPGSHDYAFASKNSLVFLVPGVKKFSRKLVKGNHYFNSVSDVLCRVASNPELIELDSAAGNDSTNKEDNGWTKETNLNRESSPDQQRRCYLKPRTPNCSNNIRKFTVVDTSPTVEKTRKIRELRSLPLGVLETSYSENDSDNEEASEEKTIESDSVTTMYSFLKKIEFSKVTKCSIGKVVPSDMDGVKNNPSREHLPVTGIGSGNLSSAFKDQKMDMLNDTKRKAIKCQSNWRAVPDNKNVQRPVTKKRRRLTACNHAERNCNTDADIFVAPRTKPVKVNNHQNNSKSSKTFLIKNLALGNKVLADLPAMEKKTSTDPLSIGSLIINREAVPAPSSSATEEQSKKSLPRAMIDLNLPVSHEDEGNESFVREMSETQQKNTRKELADHSARAISQPVDNCQHQSEMNGRRQSTRNRPLTTKVLEAFAFGYLDRKEKRKSRDHAFDSSMSRPSRRACTSEFTGCNGLNFQKDDRGNGIPNDVGKGMVKNSLLRTCFKSHEG
ncbi:hypothetical protein QN277_006335 [Acacia crassicarpa]|uniref:SANT domain-containing protein n=1 Tax=Acacia crassicarpa TaxID=499986 RepID=A0AAE1IV29_9FABA|nr:hypothetical protein QN277_006335 [Acacia crassicarpa]